MTHKGREGAAVSTPMRASDRDLRALAGIVRQDRPDLPGGDGLPPSLLAGLMGQIRCDARSLDSGQAVCPARRVLPHPVRLA